MSEWARNLKGKWAVLSSPIHLHVPVIQKGEWDESGDDGEIYSDLGTLPGPLYNTTTQRTHMQHQTPTQAVHTQGNEHREGLCLG